MSPVEAVAPASAAPVWLLGEVLHPLDRPFLVGILNITDDSFYDGGQFVTVEDAVERGLALAAEGAGMIDVGAESTRPGALPVSREEQQRRLEPVVAALVREGLLVSVDTRDWSVADRLLSLGAVAVNDVSGLGDSRMTDVVAGHGASVVVMHMQGEPASMQQNPRYEDVVAEVRSFLLERTEAAVSGGIDRRKIVVDPGIGFGKRLEHNLALLASLDRLAPSGAPVMVGISRKSFLGAVAAGETPSDRLAGSLAASVVAWQNGARLFRTHDPAETLKALRVAAAIPRGAAA